MSSLLNTRIGLYLAVRQIRRSSKWTTGLIIAVMILTSLNLIVVSGILVGLIQGAIDAVRTHYTSDVIISTLNNKSYIENSPEIMNILRGLPQIEVMSPRYLKGGMLEANYKTRIKDTDKPNTASASMVGIDPVAENLTTQLSSFIVEGSYLEPDDYDQILVGSYMIKKYQPFESPGFSALDDVEPGTKIRITVGEVEREVTVKGIIKSKVDEVSFRGFMVDSQFRSMIGRGDYNVSEIAIKLKPGADPAIVRDTLLRNGVGTVAKVQTYADAQPKFIKDLVATFALLGNMISSIGLVVASITIFIVIFINAITRRKFIGILKGIGVNGKAIEISYVFQSIFYALIGSAIGIVLVYTVIQPFFTAHPINFPFSDGILVAPFTGTMARTGLLIFTTIVAGYIPARMIVRKNTLDSILGRK
jgi:ABC-type lipoprotein release transport system permease subunit